MESNRIDSSRIVGGIPDVITCMICHDLVIDPKECIVCDKLNCNSCLMEVKAISNQCPNCRSEMNLKGMNRHVKEFVYDKLEVKCCNFEFGCGVVPLCDLEKHERNCPHGKRTCEWCQNQIPTAVFSRHVEECPHKKVSCQYCKKEMKLKDLTEHHHSVCERFPLACSGKNTHNEVTFTNTCGEFLRSELEAHKKVCPFRTTLCIYCCKSVQVHYLEYHINHCSDAYRECKHCRQRFRLHDRHFGHCPMELFPCKWDNCKFKGKRDALPEHEKRCMQREVECRNCKALVVFQHIKTHTQSGDCVVACKFCGEKARRADIGQHLKVCTKNEVVCPVEGCEHKCRRNELDRHLTDPSVALQHITHLVQRNQEQAVRIKQLSADLETESAVVVRQTEIIKAKKSEVETLTAQNAALKAQNEQLQQNVDSYGRSQPTSGPANGSISQRPTKVVRIGSLFAGAEIPDALLITTGTHMQSKYIRARAVSVKYARKRDPVLGRVGIIYFAFSSVNDAISAHANILASDRNGASMDVQYYDESKFERGEYA